jgi:hypothetical protein
MQVSRWVVLVSVCLLAGCGGGGGGGAGGSPDTTPAAFSFSGQTGATRSSIVTSNSVVISDINGNAPISITGGEYSIDGGAFTSAAGTVANNQTIRVRATSSSEFAATVTVVLTVGGVSASFTVTTGDPDSTPNELQFERIVNATRGTQATSNTVTVASIDVPVPVSIENGEYSIDSGAFTSTAGTIRAGQTLSIRARASTTYSKLTVARVTVGTVTTDFEVLSELPSYVPDSVTFDGQDVVYLLNSANRLIFRWSLAEERYLDAYEVGVNNVAPATMAYSGSHRRLYLGYASGPLRYIDAAAGSSAEVEFANVTDGVGGLVAAGNFVWVQSAGYYPVHSTFDRSGTRTYQDQWSSYSGSGTYAWDPANSRVYLFRGYSPDFLIYDVIDPATGRITFKGESPYYSSNNMHGPIRISANGRQVLLGSGSFYSPAELKWSSSLGEPLTDANWLTDGSLVTLSTANNQTTLRRRDANLGKLEQLTYAGRALRVVGTDTKMAVLVVDNGTLRFNSYAPSTDTDGDGVINTQDAFPNDVAASLDTDRDGYPDAWNTGRGSGDSTTELSLDAFPQDSACYLASQGNGASCNIAAAIPNYVPDQVVYSGETVYLLSSANKRVYRWSIASSAYLNPYSVGIAQGSTTLVPTRMAYSSGQQRLYLGYSTGAIQYIDVTSTSTVEIPFAATAKEVGGLVAAGNYVLAQDTSGFLGTHYVFDRNGALSDRQEWTYYGMEYTWDPVSSRVYYIRDNATLRFNVIDQSNGRITLQGESPYNGSNNFQAPLRVSASGQYVLIGGGDLVNRTTLSWAGSVGSQIVDARWLANGSVVTVTTANNQTTLRRLGSNFATLEQLSYPGQALRVVGTDARMALLSIENGSVRFRIYTPADDNDNDGVPNTQDAFPLDPAASLDSDRDGYPDAWNAGRNQDDSTTGLSLDAYPQDSACYLASHGNGGNCDYTAAVPNYVPDQVVQSGDTVYLLSSANRRVYRWSIASASYLNPYVVGINQCSSTIAPTRMAYSSEHQRLYLGYSTGAIRYIDLSSGAEVQFAYTSRSVEGLASAGNYVVAQDGTPSWASHYIFNRDGTLTDQRGWNYYSREYGWDAASSRMYYFGDLYSPNDLYYEVIDQTTGQVTSTGETPYHGAYSIQPPIRVSTGGQYVLLGSGDIYNRNGLTWSGSVGSQLIDARWFANNSLAVLRSTNNQTTLRHLSTSLTTLEQRTYAGTALRVVGSDSRMAVVVNNNGTTQFHIYVPSEDSDGDGVPNTQDAFPLDPAASIDTDRDGYPDAWNPGSGQGGSTTGLSLDAYPQDAACYLASHGDGVNCDYGATIPNYVPDQVVNVGDTVYLLSSANKRVYRWSIATRAYLDPYVVGIDQGFSTLPPTLMAYSGIHQRLYLGYDTGAIRYIDVTSGGGAEVPFADLSGSVRSLASVGNYMLAQDGGSGYNAHFIFAANGTITEQRSLNYSREYSWDPVSSRVYFHRDDVSPNDLHYAVVNQSTGQITALGETPYHGGNHSFLPPIRVSLDGEYILIGSGDIYGRTSLTRQDSLGKVIKDARWTEHALVDVDSTDRVEIRDLNTRAVLASYQHPGQPIALVFGQTEAFLVHVVNDTTTFARLPFGDQDHDSLPQWWEQLHGLSDSTAADALGDLDGDGVSNQDEYLHHSNPLAVDSDGDGLTDQQEIVTYSTDPSHADTDRDGLLDDAEVLTHHSDPLDADSDDDNYTDFDEVLYGGDPNDETAVPQPLVNHTQSFENNADLRAWSTPEYSSTPWTIDTSVANTGAASLKSGTTNNLQNSSIRFRGFFTAGQLSFYVRADSQQYSCCDELTVLVDGQQSIYMGVSNQWNRYIIALPRGVHTIEWRYERNPYYGQSSDTAHLDDVVFIGQ